MPQQGCTLYWAEGTECYTAFFRIGLQPEHTVLYIFRDSAGWSTVIICLSQWEPFTNLNKFNFSIAHWYDSVLENTVQVYMRQLLSITVKERTRSCFQVISSTLYIVCIHITQVLYPLISVAHFFRGFVWNFQRLLAMVNLQFYFLFFWEKNFF